LIKKIQTSVRSKSIGTSPIINVLKNICQRASPHHKLPSFLGCWLKKTCFNNGIENIMCQSKKKKKRLNESQYFFEFIQIFCLIHVTCTKRLDFTLLLLTAKAGQDLHSIGQRQSMLKIQQSNPGRHWHNLVAVSEWSSQQGCILHHEPENHYL